MPGNLFTNYFLTEGIKATAEWRASISDSTAFAAFRDGVRQRCDALSGSEGPNEAVTEQELIRPVLELLGWADYLPQQGTPATRTYPTISSSPMPHLRSAPPGGPTLRNDSVTPSWWRRASVSVSPSMPATGTTDANPGRPTAKFSGTSRRLTSSRRAESGGDS